MKNIIKKYNENLVKYNNKTFERELYYGVKTYVLIFNFLTRKWGLIQARSSSNPCPI